MPIRTFVYFQATTSVVPKRQQNQTPVLLIAAKPMSNAIRTRPDLQNRLVTGHEFTRAEKRPNKRGASAPAQNRTSEGAGGFNPLESRHEERGASAPERLRPHSASLLRSLSIRRGPSAPARRHSRCEQIAASEPATVRIQPAPRAAVFVNASRLRVTDQQSD
jgi:hypothetical protein